MLSVLRPGEDGFLPEFSFSGVPLSFVELMTLLLLLCMRVIFLVRSSLSSSNLTEFRI